MATYNGERFIAEQIDSLLAQTVRDFKLIICDDCSTDNTFSIISGYAERYPEKITVSQNIENSGGAKHNFLQMMIQCKDDYIMLSDQDDVWLPDKIKVTLEKIRVLESLHTAAKPLLVFTDLKVVDENLNTISESFSKAAAADYSKTALNYIIAQNIIAGCTAMYNKALAELVQTPPEYTVMHDWWLILLASAFGKIDVVDQPTILYRQHNNNDIGAKKLRSFKNIAHEASNYTKMAAAIDQTYKQADSLLRMYSNRLSKHQIELLKAYISIPGLPRLRRLRILFKYRAFKNGFARKAAQVIIALSTAHS